MSQPEAPSLGGRPTTYKEEYCQLVIQHLGSGFSLESFGALVDAHKDTIYEWAKVHPPFSDAIKQGRAKQAWYYENLGISIARGEKKTYKYTDPENGKKVEKEFDPKKANIVSFIWMTKNMLKWKDKIEQTVEDKRDDRVEFKMTVEEIKDPSKDQYDP